MRKRNIFFIALVLLTCAAACTQRGKNSAHASVEQINNDELFLLVGTYTSGNSASRGIYVYRFNVETGESEYVSMAEVSNPSFLTVSSDEQYVYSVGEGGGKESAANSFSFDKQTGTLKLLNTQPTKGAGPCHINTDKNGNFVVTANYSGGNISVFPIANDGTLQPVTQVIGFEGSGPDPERQTKPYLHCTVFSPDGNYLYAEDLGTDRVHKFTVNSEAPFLSTGNPASFVVEPGSGPRHLTFHPNGKSAYLINELSGKVTVFRHSNGDLSEIQYIASDTTAGFGKKGSADIHVSPDGKYLYASNRLKSDGIAIFSINATDGQLIPAGYQSTGIHPRNFNITPNGKYLLAANMNSNNIQVFEIDQQTGLLTDTEKLIILDQPVCLTFIYP
jgi:6-phosphogluconolactonase (cycloisomerase 2 family)